jgi:hypothetical protein
MFGDAWYTEYIVAAGLFVVMLALSVRLSGCHHNIITDAITQ